MVYSAVLYSGTVTNTAGHTALFTVPAGRVYVMRDIDGYCNDTVASFVTFGDSIDPLSLLLPGANPYAIAWRGRYVMTAGYVLRAFPRRGPLVLRISGYDLAS